MPCRRRTLTIMPRRLLLITALFACTGLAGAADTGKVLYDRYRASCHGKDGRGDGPAAAALSPRPTDLTRLTSALPALMEQISGRQKVVAHGSSAMPVWGVVFEESLLHEAHGRRTALLQLREIAEHARSLQKSPQ